MSTQPPQQSSSPASETPPPAASPATQAAPAATHKNFFATLPGVMTALAGTVGAVTALLTALNQAPWLQPKPTATPTATVTPEVTQTPAVVSPTQLPTIAMAATSVSTLPAGSLLMDDFSDPSSGWQIQSTDEYAIGYADGQYRVYVATDQYDVWGEPLKAYDFADLQIEVDAGQISGPEDALYGVIVREQDDDTFYLFTISSLGVFSVQRSDVESFVTLVEWQESAAIKPLGEMNHLKVECLGAAMHFYVNGELLVEITDNTYASGSIGLLASTVSDPIEMRFDNVQVRPLQRF